MASIKNDPAKVKRFWERVNKLVAGLPEAAADVIRKGAQEMLDKDGQVDIEELTDRVTPEFSKVMNTAKPLRSMKLTPKLAKRVKEDKVWLDDLKKKVEKLKAKKDAIEAEAEALLTAAKDRKEALNALVIVEMGISTNRSVFRINHETFELEIMHETKFDMVD